ncbi:hypothetical protein [Longimicrobium sp.]|uniref:hypothetical protein n=1 Tax=Longimicrobium sp. TaxID=2029185 RepID=UPI002F94C8F3
MNLTDMRNPMLSAAGVLLLAACGGDGGDSAAPKADSAATTAVTSPASAIPADSAGGLVGAPTGSTGASPVFVPQPGAPPAGTAPQRAAEAPKAAPKERIQAPAPPPPNVEVKGPVSPAAIEDYRLSMDKIRQMRQAGLNLAALQREHPELAGQMKMEGPPDPNRMYERLNSIPQARAAVERSGMSARDYTIGMGALMQGVIVHQMRKRGMNPPVQAKEANVEFIAANETEIMQLLTSAAAQAGAMPRP